MVEFARIELKVSSRRCGGWIAVSGEGAEIKIGVTAETEEGARAAFEVALARWEKILNSPPQVQSDRRCQ